MPAVIDLFSGVGGLSLGAARAGFDVACAVELDPIASAYHALNFPTSRHMRGDVSTLNGDALLLELGLQRGQIDGIIGGPPCQGFSEAGRKDAEDPRNQLLGHFFRLVSEIRPRFFLAENVPGVLAARNTRVLEQCLALIPQNYTVLPPITVKANEFGAATSRKRILFVGYDSRRMHPISPVNFEPMSTISRMNVEEALFGLPSIRPLWQSEEQSWRQIEPLPQSEFYERIRNHIPKGVGNSAALDRYQSRFEVSGCLGTLHAPETIARFRALQPGDVDRVSRGVRLSKGGLCPTLRAGTGSDKGSYQAVRPIHHSAHRVITPREAARLQGFPDWFVFHPTKWNAFRQIGNSVSPIVAEAILTQMYAHLGAENPSDGIDAT